MAEQSTHDGIFVTNTGLKELTDIFLESHEVKWNKIAVGDGNGAQYVPEATQTQLRNKLWEGNITDVSQIEDNYVEFSTIIPGDIGPFIIREIGILNDSDQLVAVTSVPDLNKLAANDNSAVFTDMDICLGVLNDNASKITVEVDPNVSAASKGYVEREIEKLEDKIDNIQLYVCDETDALEILGEDFMYMDGDVEYMTDADIDALFPNLKRSD